MKDFFTKTPQFWYQKSGLVSHALTPLSWVWMCVKKNNHPVKLPVPVICVGNFTAGGAGKTPVVASIAHDLKAHNPHIITRGFGGKIKNSTHVDLKSHNYKAVGDEPLLLAKVAPTWVGKNRIESANLAINSGAGCLILDDGMQDTRIKKDLTIAVVAGGYGVGNGKVIPAGPLREPIKKALKRVDKVLIMNGCKDDFPYPANIIHGKTTMTSLDAIKDEFLFAFAGLGLPQKFFDQLQKNGCKVVKKIAFPDHYAYKNKDIELILKTAKSLNLTPVTTEKDLIRIPQVYQDKISIVGLTASIPELFPSEQDFIQR